MNLTTLLHLLNLFIAGLLAGIEFAAHYGFTIPANVLDAASEIRLRQALILRLRVLVPAVFAPAFLSAIAVQIVDGRSPGLPFRCVAILAMILWILVRVVATVSINSATLEWNPSSPPDNWRHLIERVERFHIVGVWAAIAAFATLLASYTSRS